MRQPKIRDEVKILSTGQTGIVIHKNGEVLHIETPQGEIIKTETNLVRVLGLIAEILASLVKIIAYFK